MRFSTWLGLLAIALHSADAQRPASVTSECQPLSRPLGAVIDSGWTFYRAGDLDRAEGAFRRVLSRCPAEPGASTGAGYVRLRRGDLRGARALFSRALEARPSDYDALTGLGMSAFRAGDLPAARHAFERALAAVPRDSLTLSYLARLPAAVDSSGLAPLVRPPETIVAARAGQRIFEIPDGRGGWTPFWIKGLNLGAALPGRHPSEFPLDDGTYERWLELAAEMGVNTIRVYTVHPPHFYRALKRWNETHADRPIRLIHGVWTELPPGKKQERYDDPAWLSEFRTEMTRVVDLLHGRAVIAPRAGHASGTYRDDVSRWLLAYIIGREWEPYSIVAYDALRPSRRSHAGQFLTVASGTPSEVWLAEQCDYLVSYEMRTYNSQRPIAYTNWPTLDPLHHPTETTLAEEDSILRARREVLPEKSKEYDNDIAGLDARRMRPTTAYPAGTFASFHAYPYYPDFIALDTGYAQARTAEGPSSYYGYLRALIEHHGDLPVVISEYGVPSSRGIAHFEPQGWHHGGHSEQEMARIDARMTRDIHRAGAAGAILFATIDEWFKKNWLMSDFELPADRNRLWLNVLDAEQNYGVLAMRAGPADSAIVIDGRGDDWRGRTPLYVSTDSGGRGDPLRIRSLTVASDEAYVHLKLEVGAIDWSRARYLIGIDTYREALGDRRMPYTGTPLPVGLEFVVDLSSPEGSRLLVDEPYNLYRHLPIRGAQPPATMAVYNRPFRTVANDNGRYDTLLVETNRRRLGRDGQVFPRQLHDRNLLRHARETEHSLADWYADSAAAVIEVRLAWGMLHVLDPSSRTVLFGQRGKYPAGVPTPGFRFVVESYDPRNPAARTGDRLPRTDAGFGVPPLWSWPTWEMPRWHVRRKPVIDVMRRTFDAIR